MSEIVFLTGGTGSFGQGFVRHLLADPDISMIRIFSRDEHKQRIMRNEFGSEKISYFIGDVRDKDRLLDAMESSDWVVHAAALKQAPLSEIEPLEFIKTNVYGSINVVMAAQALKVKRAILVSTDKAVEPVNLYGATKMCAERVFIQADICRGSRLTRFSCTRYGNVAGTSGSIVPILLNLKPGEPSVIYDPKATRFWITLNDANRFVLQSLKDMKGGEVFVPKLKSVRIVDVVSAVRPHEPIFVAGTRPGDKRHEVLSLNGHRYSSENNAFMTIEEIKKDVFSYAAANSVTVGSRSTLYS